MLTSFALSRRALLALSTIVAVAACSGAKQEDTVDPDAALMTQGLALLYESADPYAAATVFRQVLSRTPTHYGARYQLAAALDSAGQPTVARPEWQEVLRMAEATGDTTVAGVARVRLAAPDTSSESAMMRVGLHRLYTLDSAATAVDAFQALLKKNPTHYGATYQLASALDRAGRATEARPIWVRMLGMAVAAGDSATATTARTRLAQR